MKETKSNDSTERMKSPLGEFSVKRRQELGINQMQLAQASDISSGTIASIESGHSQVPKADTLQKLAKGLKVSYQELDCIARGIPFQPEIPIETEPLREFEFYLMEHPKMPKEVAEMLIEMIRTAVRKYE